MAEIAHSQQAFAEIELFLSEGKFNDAKLLSTRLAEENPEDRQSKLYLLLVNVTTDGPEPYEQEIDQLRNFSAFSEVEKEIVRRVFIAGFKSAEKEGREYQAWIYQRLLRRLLLDQALDQPVSQPPNRSLPPDPHYDSFLANDRRVSLSDKYSQWLNLASQQIQSAGMILREGLSSWLIRSRDAWHRLDSFYGKHKIPLADWKLNVSSQRALVGASAGLLISIPIIYFLSTYRHPSPHVPVITRESHSTETNGEPEATLRTVALSENTSEAETINKRPLQSLLPEQLSGLRRAYNDGIQKNPNLMGSLVLKMKMDATGNVVKVEDVTSRLSDAEFVKSVLSEVRNWKFHGASAGAGEFTLPLLFVPQDMDPRTIVRWERTVNPSTSDAKLLVPLQITNSTRTEQQRTASLTPVPKPAETKSSKILINAPAKIEKSERSVRRPDHKTRRVVPLREEPRFAAAKTEDLNAGTAVSIIETKGDWLKVKTGTSGSVGYVRKEYVIPLNGFQ